MSTKYNSNDEVVGNGGLAGNGGLVGNSRGLSVRYFPGESVFFFNNFTLGQGLIDNVLIKSDKIKIRLKNVVISSDMHTVFNEYVVNQCDILCRVSDKEPLGILLLKKSEEEKRRKIKKIVDRHEKVMGEYRKFMDFSRWEDTV